MKFDVFYDVRTKPTKDVMAPVYINNCEDFLLT